MMLRSVLRKAILIITVGLLGIGIGMGTVGNIQHKSYVMALVAALMLAGILAVLTEKKPDIISVLDSLSPLKVCIVLSGLCLLINGVWVLIFHPVQAADYQTIFIAASDLSQGLHPSNRDYLALFPHLLGYAAFLSVIFRFCGQSILVAALANVVLTTCSGILLYTLSLKWTRKQSSAAVIYLLWIICPSKLLYNTMTLSEPYYSFFLLVFFTVTAAIFIRKRENQRKPMNCWIQIFAYALLAACSLALVNSARPIGIIPLIAFVIWYLMLTDRNWFQNRWKEGGFFLTVMVVCYLILGSIWNSFVSVQLEQMPPAMPGYNIYVGFNPETQGSYSDEDMDLLQNRYYGEYNRNAVAVQNSMLESALERIKDTKENIPSLMIHKLGTLLGHDEGGAFYSKESMTNRQYALWCVASNTWYYLVFILVVAGMIGIWRQNRTGDSFWIVPLCVTGIILAQLLVEVAARYHYCLIPMLLLIAAQGLNGQNSFNNVPRSEDAVILE